MFGVGALAAVGVLAFGSAALLQLGYLNPSAWNRGAVASHPEGAVLGGAGGPGPSSSATSSAAPLGPEAVIARLDFDELPIGQLARASDNIGLVAGDPEVVAFPSPFDRSVRVVGDGSHRFCLPTANLHDARVAFEMELYADTPLDSGWLRLSMAPSGGRSTVATVPLKLLDRLRPGDWHRLRAVWTPLQPVAITIGDSGIGQIETLTKPAGRDARPVFGAVCVAISAMAEDAVLLVDNLRVEQ